MTDTGKVFMSRSSITEAGTSAGLLPPAFALGKRWIYATKIEAERNTGHVTASTRTNPSPDKDRRGNNDLENYFDVEGRRSAS